MSLLVMSPTILRLSSITGNFSIRCLCRISFASSIERPALAVMTSFVITSDTLRRLFFSKVISRLVMMPASLSPSSTSSPETPYSAIAFFASATVTSGLIVYGCSIITDSDLFTFRISST